jgi:endoglucanase
MKRTLWLGAVLWLFAALTTCGQAAGLSPLHADGTKIVDARGHAVTLHGINLGGWLVEEPWMQPFVTKPPDGSDLPPIKDHVSLWTTIAKRFGPGGKQRVQTAFREAWLNESDFGRIHHAGLNCVRLPFLASLLDEPNGFHWLDQAVAWAGQNGIYVILDMHGAPGGQSDQGHTGEAGRNEFFKNPANVAQAAVLWTRIAQRYKDNPTVAGYDLLNEPTGTPGSDTLYVVMDRLYQAVRSADPSHLVFIEDGYTGAQWMPFPGPCGWKNVVYSTHYYHFDSKTVDDQQKASNGYVAAVEKERDRRQVPFYVGEFGLEPHGTTETLAGLVQAMDAGHLSWSMWTYKVTWSHGGQSLWSLYSNVKPLTPLDPYRDSEADLIQRCAQFRTENLDLYAAVAQGFQPMAAHTAQTPTQ